MNTSKRPLIQWLAAAVLVAGASAAHAKEAGDLLFRFGVSNVSPKSDNHPVVSVDDATSATINLGYMLSNNWAVEVLAAYPFKHDITLTDGTKVGSTKHLPPTVSLQYHFNTQGKFQPYLGLGVNYTTFFNTNTEGPLEGTDLSLRGSWGLAGQVGADIFINEKWFINLDARYIDIETRATLDGADLGKVAIDPYVYGVHAGFRF